MHARVFARLTLLGLLTLSGACIWIVRTSPRAVPLSEPVTVDSPVKAHLVDGSVVVFPVGVTYASDSLRGMGRHHDLTLRQIAERRTVPLDSVLGVEAIEGGVDASTSIVLSSVATAAGVAGAGLLAVAIFGSCPTVYASSSPEAPMEAELFSHSIVPLAEARDVDRLELPGTLERVTLDIRNEALETHFINHLELLEVSHEAHEWVTNDAFGLPLALSNWIPTTIRDRDGLDVSRVLSERDSMVFATSPARLSSARLGDFDDHLVIDAPAPRSDSAAVVLRMRNSLLNTVLLYDYMLGRAGLEAVDWLGGTMERLGTAVETGRWYQSRMGMRVEVWDDGAFRPAGRIGDSGPLAWKQVALVVPVPSNETRLRIRLSFLTDQWRIDRIRVAATARRPETRTVPLSQILDRNGLDLPEASAAANTPDGRYLETGPGTVVQAVFEPGSATGPRTFLLASQGYYTEWIRPDWIRTAVPPEPFVPSDSVLMLALERWRQVKTSMEREFYNARIPTR
jgi:hypothetical protein